MAKPKDPKKTMMMQGREIHDKLSDPDKAFVLRQVTTYGMAIPQVADLLSMNKKIIIDSMDVDNAWGAKVKQAIYRTRFHSKTTNTANMSMAYKEHFLSSAFRLGFDEFHTRTQEKLLEEMDGEEATHHDRANAIRYMDMVTRCFPKESAAIMDITQRKAENNYGQMSQEQLAEEMLKIQLEIGEMNGNLIEAKVRENAVAQNVIEMKALELVEEDDDEEGAA